MVSEQKQSRELEELPKLDELIGVDDEPEKELKENKLEENEHEETELEGAPEKDNGLWKFPNLKCVASSSGPVAGAEYSKMNHIYSLKSMESYNYKSAQWTPDGTSLITSDTTNNLRTYIVPPDVLQKSEMSTVTPYASFQAPEPIYAFTPYPRFDLQDYSTTLILSSIRDHPLRLTNALVDSPGAVSVDSTSFKSSIVTSYRLVDANTERWICPHSLLFTQSGNHFVAGSESLISTFDVNRKEPEHLQRTSPPKSEAMKGGVKGLVSTLSINSDRLLAFGTYSRNLGFYENEGRGQSVAFFSVAHDRDRLASKDMEELAGWGITQVEWSPCSRYLYVAERKSDVVQIYDVRVTGQLLGWLRGRNAQTNQRLGVQILNTEGGHEVWAGGADGVIRMWSNPHQSVGAMEPVFEYQAHDDPVTSTLVHRTGQLLVTCSGENKNPPIYDSDSSDNDSSDEGEDSDTDSGVGVRASETSSSASSDSLTSPVSAPAQSLKTQGGLKLWSL